MNDFTPQDLADVIAYHAVNLSITLRKFNEIENDLKALSKADPDLVIHWPMDERLSMAITAFGIALENEPTDIQDALESWL